MYDLRNFNPRNDLEEYENEYFVFDTSEQFSLNENDEKIWSYNVEVNREVLPVIVQLMWFEKKLHISYSTEHTSEQVRIDMSDMALRIQEILRPKVRAEMVLEHPIISDLDIYAQNCLDEHNTKVHAEIIVATLNGLPVNEKEEHTFGLYGKDGILLGTALQEFGFIRFEQQEGIAHELIVQRDLTKEEREKLIELVQFMGYSLSYEEIEAYDEKTALELFSSGLIQIEK